MIVDEQLHQETPDSAEEDPGWPIGFLVISGLAAVYLIVRFAQLGTRFFEWIF